ncbi:unnamed protein product [Arctogadus glacialis]
MREDDFLLCRDCPPSRFLGLYVLSFPTPRDLVATAQVSWHWRSLAKQDSLWSGHCIRRGWFLSYSPRLREGGAWRDHYVSCVSSLDWSATPPPPRGLEGGGGEEEEEVIRERLQQEKGELGGEKGGDRKGENRRKTFNGEKGGEKWKHK